MLPPCGRFWNSNGKSCAAGTSYSSGLRGSKEETPAWRKVLGASGEKSQTRAKDHEADLQSSVLLTLLLTMSHEKLSTLWNVIEMWIKNANQKCKRRKGRIYLFECRVPKIARRDKKAFLSDQCKEIEENNRMGKTRNHFRKIRDTRRVFHAEMGKIKDRTGKDLTEAEDIKKRWQENTEELSKEILMTKITTMVWSLT